MPLPSRGSERAATAESGGPVPGLIWPGRRVPASRSFHLRAPRPRGRGPRASRAQRCFRDRPREAAVVRLRPLSDADRTALIRTLILPRFSRRQGSVAHYSPRTPDVSFSTSTALSTFDRSPPTAKAERPVALGELARRRACHRCILEAEQWLERRSSRCPGRSCFRRRAVNRMQRRLSRWIAPQRPGQTAQRPMPRQINRS